MVAPTQDGFDPSAAHRLPYSVEPTRYDLRLVPDLETARFTGEVVISATANEKVSEVVLNAAELDVTSAEITTGEGQSLQGELRIDEEAERITIVLPQPVSPGSIDLKLDFAGILNDQLHGFYRSTYTDAQGRAATIATTQMEATDTRRAFPCFDEPDRKAVFSITVDVPDGLSAFSNGPVVEQTPLGDGRVRVRFGDTIPMSSYLVACIVGSLTATAPVDVDGTAVRVVHVPGKEAFCEFALEVAAHALRFFTEWFGLPYPAEKLDLVAIPDFAFGAMENLGCITFREVVLLIDPERASRTELERVADVISHEVAHMWFGDLVTMKWWNGIWLNEAFATFMELLSVDAFRPQWDRWTGFGIERAAALATDGLHSTRPVEYPVGPPEEANGMFDVLTYQKGASVLRMLEQYLGEERFREGVRSYLSKHRLSNTETSDLWDAIEEASGEPVRQIMDGWILQGGFPVVSVAEPGDAAAPGGQTEDHALVLSQEPFSYSPAEGESAIGDRWQVPVVARVVPGSNGSVASRGSGNGEQRVLLGAKPVALAPGAGAGEGAPGAGSATVLVNAHGNGYYRVHYPASYLRRLSGHLRSLDPLERANLLNDTWASVVAGRSELEDFLRLSESLGDESDPDVWLQVTSALGLMDHAVDDRTRPELSAYTRSLLAPVLGRLGWEPSGSESERAPALRAQVVAALGTIGDDPAVVSECSQRQRAELSGTARVDPDIASAVALVAASRGGRPEFEAFLERYRHPETPQEEARYRGSLAAFTDPALAKEVFDLAMREIRTQDVPFVMHSLLSSRENGVATWGRVKDNWEALTDRLPSQSLPRMLDAVRMLCRDAELVRDVEEFVGAHPVKTGRRTVEQTLERLRVNLAFSSRLGAAAQTLSAGVSRLGGG